MSTELQVKQKLSPSVDDKLQQRSQLVLASRVCSDEYCIGFTLDQRVTPDTAGSSARQRCVHPWHGIIRRRIARCRAMMFIIAVQLHPTDAPDGVDAIASREFRRNKRSIVSRVMRRLDAAHGVARWPVHHYRYRGDTVFISQFAAWTSLMPASPGHDL